MAQRDDNPMLDPFCQFCGQYKGVGPCSNPKCTDSQTRGTLSSTSSSRKTISRDHRCTRCQREASVECERCGTPFCNIHSHNLDSSVMIGKDHIMGTCVLCGKRICENCWILDDEGRITCLEHRAEHRTIGR